MDSFSFPYEEALLWIILAPLFGAIIVGFFGRNADKSLATGIAVGSVGVSFLLSLVGFIHLLASGPEATINFHFYEWFSIWHPSAPGNAVPVNFSLVLDSLSGIMCVMVTGIATLIHVYSVGYMSEDKSYTRFFAYLNLFTASMLILVLASNLPLMFVGWEGVGLCSYLLIGFWWENPAYAAAGRKAFVANRIGDFGVLVGMFFLVATIGSFEFSEINAAAGQLDAPAFIGSPATLATVSALFLFLGCAGKSAQIPLYVWLPDAMAGPTPVSALIHAATMVTSGVYLCCRLSPVFLQSPTALAVIALVGTATALLAATIAVVQRDIKKILAYSTVSQLGFMFAAVGVGAFTAGIFHVFTHAFFKACLFLGAGSVMHAVGAHGDANIFKLGGLRKILPRTHATFLIACIAIAGLPLFAGFFSKDEILLGAAQLAFAGEAAFSASWIGWVVLIGLSIAATLTAFYMFRLYFLTFTGSYRSAGEEAHGAHGDDHDHAYDAHPHESPASMTIPLIVLAAGSAVVGFLGLPHAFHLPSFWGPWLENAVAHVPAFGPHDAVENMTPVYVAMAFGLTAAIVGVAAAYAAYNNAAEDRVTSKLPKPLFDFLFDKWRVDELYERIIIGPTRNVAVVSGRVDQSFIDAIIAKGTSAFVQAFGWLTTRPQVGVVHAYGLAMVVGVAGMSVWVMYPHTGFEAELTADGQTKLTVARGLGYEYRWDVNGDGAPDSEGWTSDPTPPPVRVDPAHFVGTKLVIESPVRPGDLVYDVGSEPLLLTDSDLGLGWQGTLVGELPPSVTLDEATGEIVIRQNLRPAEGEPLPDLRLAPGRRRALAGVTVMAAPVVRVGVEVRNSFGNVTKDEVEIVLRRLPQARRRLGAPGAQ